VNAFRVEALMVCHLEQLGENVTADFSRARSSRDAEAIAATGYFDIETAFNLPQVFIKLTAKIGKAVVIGGLENNVPRYLDSTQNRIPKPLCRKLPVRTTGAMPGMALNLPQQ
jgi:hypothetical protein